MGIRNYINELVYGDPEPDEWNIGTDQSDLKVYVYTYRMLKRGERYGPYDTWEEARKKLNELEGK